MIFFRIQHHLLFNWTLSNCLVDWTYKLNNKHFLLVKSFPLFPIVSCGLWKNHELFHSIGRCNAMNAKTVSVLVKPSFHNTKMNCVIIVLNHKQKLWRSLQHEPFYCIQIQIEEVSKERKISINSCQKSQGSIFIQFSFIL